MTEELRLAGWIRLFVGRLYNHDYLWFSSTEISRTSVTLPILHNYALCYALAQYERGVVLGSSPRYADDLLHMPLYATPAQATELPERTTVTFNALDSITLRTDVKPNVNTPDFGKRVYLNPLYERRDAEKPHLGYMFYLFVFDKGQPRNVIRLGKKGCPVRIRWEEIERPIARFSTTTKRPTHLVNPLDISGRIERYEPIALPPHLILRSAEIAEDWFVERALGKAYHIVHLPKSVVARLKDDSQ